MLFRLAAAFCLSACAAIAHAAGWQKLSIPVADGKAMDAYLWYPSKDPVGEVRMGTTVRQTLAADGAVEGRSLPLIVMSHGSGGNGAGHHDTALALAEAGFMVVAITHPGDNHADQGRAVAILDRPRAIVRTLDYMLKEWPGRAHVDPSRVGMFGFSAGGFTTLVNIGGKPDFGRVGPHCREHPSDFACQLLAKHGVPAGSAVPAIPAVEGLKDDRIRAAVVAAPALGFSFGKDGLAGVRVPVQLWRAEDDRILPHPWYAEAVHAALPAAHDYREVPNAGHFDFLAPCSRELQSLAPEICGSNPGFDRAAFHADFNREVAAFFRKQLHADASSGQER